MNQFLATATSLAPADIWGCFTRLLALVYIVTFASLAPQLLGLVGSRGVGPVRELLRKIARDYPGPRRFAYFPTLLWLNASDAALSSDAQFFTLMTTKTFLLRVVRTPSVTVVFVNRKVGLPRFP